MTKKRVLDDLKQDENLQNLGKKLATNQSQKLKSENNLQNIAGETSQTENLEKLEELETRLRLLGNCKKCHVQLVEKISKCGIWCYNHQYRHKENKKFPEIVFLVRREGPSQYKCRSCATKRERYLHDKTF